MSKTAGKIDKSQPYNGHKTWAHWNVALWLHNDEGFYRLMQDVLAREKSNVIAAHKLRELLPHRTPDGAIFTYTTVLAVVRDARE